ncbi:MAG: RHS repeat-associated core domain-containing protein, partial [Flavobacterium sp.]
MLDENNYYPFGLKQNDSSSYTPNGNNYKYNGKEYQDELGLNITAMDFRQYDNAIGRFTVIDPLAEQDFGNSPYAFAGNNPALYGDPSGLK